MIQGRQKFDGLHLWSAVHDKATCNRHNHLMPFNSGQGEALPVGVIWTQVVLKELRWEILELLGVEADGCDTLSHCFLIGTAQRTQPMLPRCFRVRPLLIPKRFPVDFKSSYFDDKIEYVCSGLQRAVSANGVCAMWQVCVPGKYPYHNLSKEHVPEAATLSGFYFPQLDDLS